MCWVRRGHDDRADARQWVLPAPLRGAAGDRRCWPSPSCCFIAIRLDASTRQFPSTSTTRSASPADINEPLNRAPCRANARRIDYFCRIRKQPDIHARYNPQGLTPEEVAASRAAHGENIITPQRDRFGVAAASPEKFRDPIIIVLLVAAALAAGHGLHGRRLRPNHRHPTAPSCCRHLPAWDFSSSGTPCGGSAGSTV